MSEERWFRVGVAREEGFVFNVDFGLDGVGDLVMDEPEPLGGETGPNASRVLAAAVGNCLCASLLFCLQRSRVEVQSMEASVSGVLTTNKEGRWRVKELDAEITPEVDEGKAKKLKRCVEIFEEFCTVSSSVRQGIPINVTVNR
jgi:organic hydroperoxide reductase OsmC/OhrA